METNVSSLALPIHTTSNKNDNTIVITPNDVIVNNNGKSSTVTTGANTSFYETLVSNFALHLQREFQEKFSVNLNNNNSFSKNDHASALGTSGAVESSSQGDTQSPRSPSTSVMSDISNNITEQNIIVISSQLVDIIENQRNGRFIMILDQKPSQVKASADESTTSSNTSTPIYTVLSRQQAIEQVGKDLLLHCCPNKSRTKNPDCLQVNNTIEPFSLNANNSILSKPCASSAASTTSNTILTVTENEKSRKNDKMKDIMDNKSRTTTTALSKVENLLNSASSKVNLSPTAQLPMAKLELPTYSLDDDGSTTSEKEAKAEQERQQQQITLKQKQQERLALLYQKKSSNVLPNRKRKSPNKGNSPSTSLPRMQLPSNNHMVSQPQQVAQYSKSNSNEHQNAYPNLSFQEQQLHHQRKLYHQIQQEQERIAMQRNHIQLQLQAVDHHQTEEITLNAINNSTRRQPSPMNAINTNRNIQASPMNAINTNRSRQASPMNALSTNRSKQASPMNILNNNTFRHTTPMNAINTNTSGRSIGPGSIHSRTPAMNCNKYLSSAHHPAPLSTQANPPSLPIQSSIHSIGVGNTTQQQLTRQLQLQLLYSKPQSSNQRSGHPFSQYHMSQPSSNDNIPNRNQFDIAFNTKRIDERGELNYGSSNDFASTGGNKFGQTFQQRLLENSYQYTGGQVREQPVDSQSSRFNEFHTRDYRETSVIDNIGERRDMNLLENSSTKQSHPVNNGMPLNHSIHSKELTQHLHNQNSFPTQVGKVPINDQGRSNDIMDQHHEPQANENQDVNLDDKASNVKKKKRSKNVSFMVRLVVKVLRQLSGGKSPIVAVKVLDNPVDVSSGLSTLKAAKLKLKMAADVTSKDSMKNANNITKQNSSLPSDGQRFPKKETGKERKIRLLLRHRLVAAAVNNVSLYQFSKNLLAMWECHDIVKLACTLEKGQKIQNESNQTSSVRKGMKNIKQLRVSSDQTKHSSTSKSICSQNTVGSTMKPLGIEEVDSQQNVKTPVMDDIDMALMHTNHCEDEDFHNFFESDFMEVEVSCPATSSTPNTSDTTTKKAKDQPNQAVSDENETDINLDPKDEFILEGTWNLEERRAFLNVWETYGISNDWMSIARCIPTRHRTQVASYGRTVLKKFGLNSGEPPCEEMRSLLLRPSAPSCPVLNDHHKAALEEGINLYELPMESEVSTSERSNKHHKRRLKKNLVVGSVSFPMDKMNTNTEMLNSQMHPQVTSTLSNAKGSDNEVYLQVGSPNIPESEHSSQTQVIVPSSERCFVSSMGTNGAVQTDIFPLASSVNSIKSTFRLPVKEPRIILDSGGFNAQTEDERVDDLN